MKDDQEIQASYPSTKKEIVTEDIHGVIIKDPFRWMEDPEKNEVISWIEIQNQITRDVLDGVEERKTFKKRLEQLQYRDEVVKVKESESGLFILKKQTDKEQPVLYFRAGDRSVDDDRKLIDINEIDPTGLTSLDYFFPSFDGKLLAYGLSEGGSEWAILYILDVNTGDNLEEKIERAKWSSVRWKRDNLGFYYTRFPTPGEVPAGEEVFGSHVRFHQIGTQPDHDPIIFENPEKPQEYPIPTLAPDDSFMIVNSWRFTASDLYLIDLTANPPQKVPVVTDGEWLLSPFIGKNRVFILSNHESSNFGLYSAIKEDLAMESWKTILNPQKNTLQEIQLVADKIMALWLTDVKSNITLHNLDGTEIGEIPIPKIGAVDPATLGGGMSGGIEFDHVFFNYMSFFQAPTTYKYNIPSNDLSVFFKPKMNLNQTQYTVTEAWYPSKDGTKVHLFIVHPKTIALDGTNATLLYGYGGFGISRTPFFSPAFLHWVERGGVFAVANIRGGGEHGDEWHKMGNLSNKQNVFDDFIAAAEYLIQKGYCTTETLGIMGGSNGGLLVGAVAVQRPELFSAVYCAVPLLDMLRYHKFSIGKTWIPEYGNPDNPEHFKWLFAYSPYHNVKEKGQYPTIFFKTAVNDSRVDPAHALKMTALMQNIVENTNPIILWVESAAGHGVGKSIKKVIEEGTEMLSFFHWRLNP